VRRTLLCAVLLAAPARPDEVVLDDGGRISGEVIEETERELTVLLPNGTMRIARAKVREIVREDRRSYLRREARGAASTRAAVRMYERAFQLSRDDETRGDLAKALLAHAAEQLQLFRLDDAEAALARLREVAPGAPSDDLAKRLAAERTAEFAAKAETLGALREGRFDEALVHADGWRLRAADGDEAVREALAEAHFGAARADESRGNLRAALDHYRMARAESDLARLAPIAVLEAMHAGDLDGAARLLGPLAAYRDPAVPRFLEAVLAHLKGEVQQAVQAYADAARLSKGGGAGEGFVPYDVVRAYATATLKQAIARPPQEGQKRWRETFLGPLEREDAGEFAVYAASADVARDAAAQATEIYARIADDLGVGAGAPGEVVLHPTREAYVAADPTPEGSPLAALALGREPTAGVCYDTLDEEGKPLIRVEVDAGQKRWLTDTLPHELVHLAQRRGWRTFRRGHWLDEGLATLYESQEAQDSRLALWRHVREESIPLPELLALRSTPPDRALLFYLEAHALCRYLRGLGGEGDWRRFLDAFAAAEFESALRTAFGVESVTDLERAFRAW
jgi:hypothetical protein